MSSTSIVASEAAGQAKVLGVPRWYATLFLTDMWERFGFYGMQAILVLYAAGPVSRGGLGLPTASAAALFGAYLGLTFMLALPGGWVGDRLLGAQRATLWGGGIIALGHFSLAVPGRAWTAMGIVLVAVGTGLFKPNQQALLNMLYGRDRARREAAISSFYVGIQISALLAPLVTGYLGERINWHLGFAAAGTAMLIGVVHFARGLPHFGKVGAVPGRPLSREERRAFLQRAGLITAGASVLLAFVARAVTAERAIILVGLLILVVPIVSYVRLLRHPELTSPDRRRLRAFLWVFLGSGLFWMLAGQDGSVLNLFAQRSTERTLLGFTVPASWLLSATPLFILALSPLYAWQLPRVGARFGLPVKFAFGLLFAGTSFLLMSVAAALAANGTKVSPLWLLCVYFLHACGELVIAAVGISAAADVVPRAFMGQTLGLWWLFAALGAGLGSQVVRLTSVMPDQIYYLALGLIVTAVGVAFVVCRRGIVRALFPADPPAATPVRPAMQRQEGPSIAG